MKNSIPGRDVAPPFPAAEMRVVKVKNTMMATISSSAAKGISVLVTGPSVLNSFTIESAGAGAVARAMLPKTGARMRDVFVK